MSDLLTFNNDIMDIIVSKLDPDSHLIVGLACKELYKILKEFNVNKNEKLSGSLKYLTSNLNLLKYAHKNGCPLDNITIQNTLDNKEPLECLKYVHHENRVSMWSLKYLHGDRSPWKGITCDDYARHGHLECLKYLHKNGCPWSAWTCGYAAFGGHLECLKYLHKNGCSWNVWACGNAVEYGHLECLKYCHENGCPWHEWALSQAAMNGHLECLKYLHENGCPWTEQTFSYAVNGGHLECVKYCKENGCPE
jgi:hypothetical protein